MHSCDLLIESLNKYEGTFVLVSHDRYFVSKTANKIWEIVDHEIKEFKGGYEEYVQWKERMAKTEVRSRESKSNELNKSNTKEAPKPQTSNNKPQTVAPINKEHKKELQKQQRIFQQLEEKVALLTKQKNELEAALTDPSTYSDKQKFIQAELAYNKAASDLGQLNKQYEEVFEKIMKLES